MNFLRFACLTVLITIASTLSASENLTFVPEPGARLDNAAIPEAGIDGAGNTYLYYEDAFPGGKQRVSISSDGLTFAAGTTYTTYANEPNSTRLLDGTYRRFVGPIPGSGATGFTATTSTDGINFTPLPGTVYTLTAADKGSSGVYNHYMQANGNIVLLYLGDLMGLNNTRMARSTDGGKSFTFVRGNVLGDDTAGGGGNSYVDITTNRLPDGRRRLFAMKGGMAIYSFISTDDGETYTQESGPRLSRTDFTEFNVTGMFDPVVVALPDGSYRMYVCAHVMNSDGSTSSKIVSAISRASAGPVVTSVATAVPTHPYLGQEVAFAAAGSGVGLTYTWTFGDGTGDTGATVNHAYAAAGAYTATCSITDVTGAMATSLVVVTVSSAMTATTIDSDGDGYVDEVEDANGSNPHNPASTPFNLPIAQLQTGALELSRLSVKFNLGRADSDSIMFTGSVTLPAGFTPDQQRILVDLGGVVRTFVLDTKGHGASGADSLTLRIKKGGTASIALKLAKSTFLSAFADEGLVNANAKALPATIGVALVIGANAYHLNAAIKYTARKDRAGMARGGRDPMDIQ